jgi:ring-1,2-phenylacetyl-CoA epoxidase subunit PaaE
VGVKEVPFGAFSTYVNKQLKAGDEIKVGVPEGRFVLNPIEKQSPVMAIAAGSGITPIMSVLKSYLINDLGSSFTLIYGNKSPEKTMFYKELRSLEKLYPKQLNIHWIFSEANIDGSRFGRIDPALINFVLKKCVSSPLRFYLCGPENMIKISQELLIDRGIDQQNIFFELFSASTDKSEILGAVNKGVLKITFDDQTQSYF